MTYLNYSSNFSDNICRFSVGETITHFLKLVYYLFLFFILSAFLTLTIAHWPGGSPNRKYHLVRTNGINLKVFLSIRNPIKSTLLVKLKQTSQTTCNIKRIYRENVLFFDKFFQRWVLSSYAVRRSRWMSANTRIHRLS